MTLMLDPLPLRVGPNLHLPVPSWLWTLELLLKGPLISLHQTNKNTSGGLNWGYCLHSRGGAWRCAVVHATAYMQAGANLQRGFISEFQGPSCEARCDLSVFIFWLVSFSPLQQIRKWNRCSETEGWHLRWLWMCSHRRLLAGHGFVSKGLQRWGWSLHKIYFLPFHGWCVVFWIVLQKLSFGA